MEFPYKKGKACSQCLEGQHCHDGLCAGKTSSDGHPLHENTILFYTVKSMNIKNEIK